MCRDRKRNQTWPPADATQLFRPGSHTGRLLPHFPFCLDFHGRTGFFTTQSKVEAVKHVKLRLVSVSDSEDVLRFPQKLKKSCDTLVSLQQRPGQVQTWETVCVRTFPAPCCPLPWHPSLFWFPFMCIYKTVRFWFLAYLKIEAVVYWTFAALHEHCGRTFHASLRHCHSTAEKWEELLFPLHSWEN